MIPHANGVTWVFHDLATGFVRHVNVPPDEDIVTLDMHEPASSPSYKSTPARFSRSSQIQLLWLQTN